MVASSGIQVLSPNHTLQRTGTAARCAAVCRPLSFCSLGGLVRSPLYLAALLPRLLAHAPGPLQRSRWLVERPLAVLWSVAWPLTAFLVDIFKLSGRFP